MPVRSRREITPKMILRTVMRADFPPIGTPRVGRAARQQRLSALQQNLVSRLGVLIRGAEVYGEWHPLTGEGGMYSPRLDLAVLPEYPTGRLRADAFDQFLRRNRGLVNRLLAHTRENVLRFAQTSEVVDPKNVFEANPGAGALSLDGRMIDRPHLIQAQRILSLA